MKEYRAPMDGWYQVLQSLTKCVPTGHLVLKNNPKRKWFHFHKPKLTMEPEYELLKLPTKCLIKFYKKGDRIISVKEPLRIKE